MLAMVANCVAICKNRAGPAIDGESVTRHGRFICRSKPGGGRNAPLGCLGKSMPSGRRFAESSKQRQLRRGRGSKIGPQVITNISIDAEQRSF